MQRLAHSSETNRQYRRPAHQLAQGLGWFSIGLGLAECLMPHTMARVAGLQGKEGVVRAFGLREIVAGIGILMSRDPEPWVWSRVAGDALDLGTLSVGLQADNPHRTSSAVAMLVVAHVTAIDFACANALAGYRHQAESGRGIDYRSRQGFSKPVREMRGAGKRDFSVPEDYRIPEALRPWDQRPQALGPTVHADEVKSTL